jgi:hypothetical protein
MEDIQSRITRTIVYVSQLTISMYSEQLENNNCQVAMQCIVLNDEGLRCSEPVSGSLGQLFLSLVKRIQESNNVSVVNVEDILCRGLMCSFHETSRKIDSGLEANLRRLLSGKDSSAAPAPGSRDVVDSHQIQLSPLSNTNVANSRERPGTPSRSDIERALQATFPPSSETPSKRATPRERRSSLTARKSRGGNSRRKTTSLDIPNTRVQKLRRNSAPPAQKSASQVTKRPSTNPGRHSLPENTSVTRRVDTPTERTDEDTESADLSDDRFNESMTPVSSLGDKKIAENIRQYLRNPSTLKRPGDEGYVYIFGDERRPGLLKIGITKNELNVRESTLQNNCKVELVRVYHTGRQIEHYKRVEQLVHRELMAFGHHGKCRGCRRRHREWFRVDEDDAKAAVKRWTDFVKKKPWDSELDANLTLKLKLKPFWDRRLNDLLSDSDEKGLYHRQPLSGRLDLFVSPSITYHVRYYWRWFFLERRGKAIMASPFRWFTSKSWMWWAWFLTGLAWFPIPYSWCGILTLTTLFCSVISLVWEKF